MSHPRVITIEIPPGAVAGDSLAFEVDGTQMELKIPEGSQPGEVLQVQVASAVETAASSTKIHSKEDDSDSNRHDEASGPVAMKFSLSSGVSLQFFSELPSVSEHSTAVDGSDHRDSITANKGDVTYSAQSTKGDGTHSHIWPSARYCIEKVLASDHLMSELSERPLSGSPPPSRRRVLELGSGTGVLGLCYASMASQSVPTTLILTDHPAALPLLEYNVAQNCDSLPPTVDVACRAMDWTRPNTDVDESTRFDMILGSDLLYNTAHIDDLARTVAANLSQSGRMLLAVRWRKPEEERPFFALMAQEHGVEWKLLSTPLNCNLEWEAFGNPEYKASNEYFCQTSLAVGGTLVPLAAIGEREMEAMSDEEHDAFEKCFMQVYLGQKKVEARSRKRRECE